MRLQPLVLLCILTLPGFAATPHPDMEAALTQIRNTNGAVFVYLHGSDWCRSGEKIKTDVWETPQLQQALPSAHALVAIDHPERPTEAEPHPRNAAAWWTSERFPAVAGYDAEGRVFWVHEDLRISETPASLAAAMNQALDMKRQRDDAWQRAEESEGIARARWLGRGLDAMKLGTGFASKRRGPKDYQPILEAIRTADPEDRSFYSRKYSFGSKQTRTEAMKLAEETHYEEALQRVQVELDHPGNAMLPVETLQELHLIRRDIYRQWPGQEDKQWDVFRTIAAMDATTTLGIGAEGYLLMTGRSVPSLTHGWWPHHLRQGRQQLVIDIDTATYFDHAGRYEITLHYEKGQDAITVHGLSLLGPNRVLSEDIHDAHIGAVARDNTYLLRLTDSPAEPLRLRIDYTADRTDNRSRIEIRSLWD